MFDEHDKQNVCLVFPLNLFLLSWEQSPPVLIPPASSNVTEAHWLRNPQ